MADEAGLYRRHSVRPVGGYRRGERCGRASVEPMPAAQKRRDTAKEAWVSLARRAVHRVGVGFRFIAITSVGPAAGTRLFLLAHRYSLILHRRSRVESAANCIGFTSLVTFFVINNS